MNQVEQKDYKGNPFTGTPRSGYEVLDMSFAVFNNHVNDADIRARALISVIAPSLLTEVEQIERDGNGIMAIFQRPSTTASLFYAGIVTAFVNEKVQITRQEVDANTEVA